jgi:ABC-type multidrug transport system ATPase subunit
LGTKAVINASLCLEKGETLGLVGPNGAGKTTLLNLINGEYSFNRGTVKNFGAQFKTAFLGIDNGYYLRSEDVLFEELTVIENFRLYQKMTGFDNSQINFWINSFELISNNKV